MSPRELPARQGGLILFQKVPSADGLGHDIRVVGDFPEVVDFSESFLAEADPAYIQQGDGIVTITVSNGSASYGIVRRNDRLGLLTGIKSQ